MGDLDANGNVINNEPAHRVRDNANRTDIRRVVADSPDVFRFDNFAVTAGTDSGSGLPAFQTIADLTGVQTCTEGIEIVHHGPTLDVLQVYRTRNHVIKIIEKGGATGGAVISNETFLIERTPTGIATEDPNGERSESIFIPTDDPTTVCIGKIVNALEFFDNDPEDYRRSTLEIRIK